jgi:hypothetical protein
MRISLDDILARESWGLPTHDPLRPMHRQHPGYRRAQCRQNYEVLQVKERDGYFVLSSGQFTMARFQPVSATEAGYG